MEKICGIYCIENLVNGKKYVGQSIDVNKRLREHRYDLRRNNHKNQRLQNSWNAYGEDQFKFYLLEQCDENLLDEIETRYIAEWNLQDSDFGYNIESGGNLNKHLSEETKQKIRDKMLVIKKDVYLDSSEREKDSQYLLQYYKDHPEGKEIRRQAGLKYFEEHPEMVDMLRDASKEYWSNEENRKRQSQNISNFFIQHPEEREKRGRIMSELMLSNPEISKKRIDTMKKNGKIRPIICVETGQVFETRLDALQWLGKPANLGTRISAVLHGREKTAYGYHWKFADEMQNQ